MRFWINEQGLKKTLFVVPDTKDETKRLDDFASPTDKLRAVMVDNPDYIYNFLEITKEA